jgi:hypothetical protein
VRGFLLLLPLLGGCNAIFGLDPTSLAGGDDAAVDTDGSAGDDAGRTIDANPALSARIWALSIDYIQLAQVVQGYQAHARFGPDPDGCARVVEAGGCYAAQCEAISPTVPAPNTGTITIEGNNLVDLVPDNNGFYPLQSGDQSLFAPEITIGVYSPGDTVPAMSSTLVSPPLVTITSPPLPTDSEMVIFTRSAGIDLTWPPASTTIHLIISDAASGRVYCDLPASTGAGSVPPAVLNQLASGNAILSVYTVERDTVAAGDFEVQVVAGQAARRFDGDRAHGGAYLQ